MKVSQQLMMVILSALMSFSHAASKNSPKCFDLDESNICGKEYEGLPVLLAAYKSVADFNEKLARVSLNEDALGTEMQNLFGCSKDKASPLISSMRFRLSFWCSREVNEAVKNGCGVSGKSFELCPEECTAAVKTTQAILNSPACSNANSTQVQNGKGMISVMNELCSKSNSGCVKGASLELQYCGFQTAEAEKAECAKQSFADISCCQKYRSA